MQYLVYWKRLLDGTISTNGVLFANIDQAAQNAKDQNERHKGYYEHWVESIPDNTDIDITKVSIKVGYFDNEYKTHVVDTETNTCLCGAKPIGKFVFCCWGASPESIDCKACRHLWAKALNQAFMGLL